MARMDISATVTKRRSIPRILSSSKKNSWLSPIDTNFIKDDAEDTGGDSFNTLTPKKEEADCSEEDHDTSSLPARTCNRSRGLITLQTGRGRTTPPLSQLKEEIKTEELEAIDDCQEIRVNPMITIRRGAQVHIPSRRVRCQVATNLVTPENCDPSKLTPNEMLLALVNLFAPPVEVEETPPQLEREASFSDDSYSTTGEQTPLADSMEYSQQSAMDSLIHAQQLSMTASTSTSFKQMANDINGSHMPQLSHVSGIAGSQSLSTGHHQVTSPGNNILIKNESKYPPMTLGGVIGIRRPRTTASQSYNNNLTLDQLNPTLAEALAAMKSKSDVTSKSSGTPNHGSEGFSTRRDSLPTRMSGPVKLEGMTSVNSTSSQCASASSSGHLVSFNGQTTEVPEEIRCHLCDYPMKLCIRKSKYKGEIREYAAYRCLRKGCQTFRSVRKVIEPDFPCPRKRKAEEIFDPGNVSPHGTARTAHDGTGQSSFLTSNASSKAEGTLLYIPGRVSLEHVEQMQKFAIGFLGKTGGTTVDRNSSAS